MNTTVIILIVALAICIVLFTILLYHSKQTASTQMHNLDNQIVQLQTEKNAAEQNLSNARNRIEQLIGENKTLASDLSAEKTRLEATQAAIVNVQTTMTSQFKDLASQVIEEKSQKFDQHSKDVLSPLQEELKRLQQKVQDTYDKSKNDQIDLAAELKKMQQMNDSLQKEANNLVTALKGDTKKQGDWGEMILERVLESSGLRKGTEYVTQDSHTTEEQKRLRPDAIVYLPENKSVIIDSKVSLTAYDRCIAAEDDQERETQLKAHIDSIKRHIKELSDKDYAQKLGLNTPEYVLMFIPIESAFSIAAQSEKDIYDIAWKQRVVIVTPTTLMATLSTINYMWKQVKQTQNALAIADRGGKLYDKVCGFVKDMDALGNAIDSAKKSYDTAVNKLQTGQGNVLSQAESLKVLGAKTTKSLKNTKIGNEYLAEDNE